MSTIDESTTQHDDEYVGVPTITRPSKETTSGANEIWHNATLDAPQGTTTEPNGTPFISGTINVANSFIYCSQVSVSVC